MEKETIQIAITAIYDWQERIKNAEGGKHESPRFFEDTDKAIKELKQLLTPQ